MIPKKVKKAPGEVEMTAVVSDSAKVLDQYTGEYRQVGEIFMMEKNQADFAIDEGSVREPTDDEVDAFNKSSYSDEFEAARKKEAADRQAALDDQAKKAQGTAKAQAAAEGAKP